MGSSSSCTKVKTFDKGIQIPSVQEINPAPKQPSSPSPSKSFYSLPPSRIRPKSNRRQISLQDDQFELDSNIEQYSSIWDHDTKLSSTIQHSLKSESTKIKHHQKEMTNNKWSKKSSTTFESARIESTFDTQSHACINLSSSDKIDELIQNLNRIHAQLDEIIKRRTEQISSETESLLSHIISETQEKQQNLLRYAKKRQIKQDENYGQLLQEYISQLDEIKAKELVQLQKELEIYRERIMEESQLKIMTVNEQANDVKTKILKEEQHHAAEKIDLIIAQVQKISTDEKLQHLGSEIMTKTNVTTNANVGTKAAGQGCTFDFEQDIPTENNSSDQHSLQYPKKTTYINERRTLHEEKEEGNHRSTKNSSAIQKSKRQE